MKKMAIIIVVALTVNEFLVLYFFKNAWDKGAITSDSVFKLGIGLLVMNAIAFHTFYSYVKNINRNNKEE